MASTNPMADELYGWFKGKIKTAHGARRALLTDASRSRDFTVIGKMYLFKYQPKYEATLPIWDRYPLMFPIERDSSSMLGLNVHYLEQPLRSQFLDMLAGLANNKKLTPRTRLRLSYDTLVASKQLASVARPCIKRYLFDHVQSTFVEIVPDEWHLCARLPIQQFIRKT